MTETLDLPALPLTAYVDEAYRGADWALTVEAAYPDDPAFDFTGATASATLRSASGTETALAVEVEAGENGVSISTGIPSEGWGSIPAGRYRVLVWLRHAEDGDPNGLVLPVLDAALDVLPSRGIAPAALS